MKTAGSSRQRLAPSTLIALIDTVCLLLRGFADIDPHLQKHRKAPQSSEHAGSACVRPHVNSQNAGVKCWLLKNQVVLSCEGWFVSLDAEQPLQPKPSLKTATMENSKWTVYMFQPLKVLSTAFTFPLKHRWEADAAGSAPALTAHITIHGTAVCLRNGDWTSDLQ